jgi:hypothetical protein
MTSISVTNDVIRLLACFTEPDTDSQDSECPVSLYPFHFRGANPFSPSLKLHKTFKYDGPRLPATPPPQSSSFAMHTAVQKDKMKRFSPGLIRFSWYLPSTIRHLSWCVTLQSEILRNQAQTNKPNSVAFSPQAKYTD